MAIASGDSLNFKCPYHANVMKMLKTISSRIVSISKSFLDEFVPVGQAEP